MLNVISQSVLNETNPRKSAEILSEVELTDNSRLRFALWGKNLSDEEYRVFGITEFGQLGFAGAVFNEPRSYGLDIIFDYE